MVGVLSYLYAMSWTQAYDYGSIVHISIQEGQLIGYLLWSP